jgi:hypothetical protein
LERIVYIHVGPAKTGTTAVQHILRAHDSSVIVYPKAGLWADISHHNLVFNYFRDYSRPEMVREDVGDLFRRIVSEVNASRKNVVISSEVLAGRNRLAEFVEALLSKLGPGFRAQLIFVVRDQLELAASTYNQRVKDSVTRERRDPDEFLAERAAHLCYAPILRRLQRTGISLSVLNYHPAQGLAARFLEHIGFPSGEIAESPLRNVSMSTRALIATLVLNRSSMSRQRRNQIVSTLRGMPRRFAPSRLIFGSQAVAAAEEHFGPDRTFLRDVWRIEFPPSQIQPSANLFALTSDEFAELSVALTGLGPDSDAMLQDLGAYVRDIEAKK